MLPPEGRRIYNYSRLKAEEPKKMPKTSYYHKNLPHFHHVGKTFSIVFQLWDAVASNEIDKINNELSLLEQKQSITTEGTSIDQLESIKEKYFKLLEEKLHLKREQSFLLANPAAAEILAKKIEQYDNKYYECCAYSILGNHVHLMLDFFIQLADDYNWNEIPGDYVNLDKVMNLIKGGSAFTINQALDRKGPVYRKGYYNRYIRTQEHFTQTLWYVGRNAEVAGLVDDWREHPFSYINPKYL